MYKTRIVIILLLLVIVSLIPAMTFAQTSNGAISGTLYKDQNADGQCANTGEPGLAGVPIEFTSGETTVFLESGQDGTYGLVAAGFSTWEVTAQPSSEWVASSLNPLFVTIDEENPRAEGINFCIAKAGAVPPTLPESGATIAPIFLAALVVGGGFLATGLALEIHRRRSA